MIPMFARLETGLRVMLAWAILGGTLLLVTIPLVVSVAGLLQAWQVAHALRTHVAALSQRVDGQYREITAWYEAQGETEDSVREYSDPNQARQAFDADLDLISQTLIEAGVHLLQTPTSQQAPLGGDLSELVGDIGFSGPFSDVLQAFITLEHSDIRLAGLTIEALPGQPAGRVRGRVQLRHAYLTVSPDES